MISSTSPSSSSDQKVAIVTGSSTGIGYQTSLILARNGFLTYATMRNLNKSEDMKLTVAKENAGYGLNGAFEDLAMDEVKAQYETNVYGLMRTTQAVLPIMRKQKSGTIVNISSGAGRFGFPGGSAYVSTKFAVEGLSESMSYELEPFGIKVVIVEPGVIRTNFMDGLVIAKKSQDPNSPYSQIMQKIATGFEEMMKNASSPDLVAKVVLNAIRDKNSSLRYLAGNDVEAWLGGNRKIADEELYKMMKQDLKM